MIELFFDLVFVFAITQLSHALLDNLTIAGGLRIGFLLLAVWWVWIYSAWVTNWLDPDRLPVRLMLFALMAAGLVLAAAIPKAFAERGLAFALAYAAMQIGRTAFVCWVLRPHDQPLARNFLRILCWLAVSGCFWLAGGIAEGQARFVLWIIALGIEFAGPAAGFWTPHLGKSTTRDWNVDAAHLSERCALFVIIALGESILVSGATFAKAAWTPLVLAAFLATIVSSIAMWWIYFNIGAEEAGRNFSESDDRGALARTAYTYMHIPIVAGIVVMAAADELVLAHPYGHTDGKTLVTTIGGAGLFVAGNLLFKRLTAGRWPLSHLIGLALLALLAPLAAVVWPTVLAALAACILVLVAVWETVSLRAVTASGAPTKEAH